MPPLLQPCLHRELVTGCWESQNNENDDDDDKNRINGNTYFNNDKDVLTI